MLPLEDCKRILEFAGGKAALQLSGGKDSVAAWVYLRPYLDMLTVYWSNPGDPLPETVELINKIKAESPNFVEVNPAVSVVDDIARYGYPVDIVPEALTPFHLVTTGETPPVLVRHRDSCCAKNLYAPVYQRIVSDGNKVAIRGDKFADGLRNVGLSHGAVDAHGILYCMPVFDETDDTVLDYLRSTRPDLIHPSYHFGGGGLMDCGSCTGWWGETNMAYLKECHPDRHASRLAVYNEVKKSCEQEFIALTEIMC